MLRPDRPAAQWPWRALGLPGPFLSSGTWDPLLLPKGQGVFATRPAFAEARKTAPVTGRNDDFPANRMKYVPICPSARGEIGGSAEEADLPRVPPSARTVARPPDARAAGLLLRPAWRPFPASSQTHGVLPRRRPLACSSGLCRADFLGDSSICCHGNCLVIGTRSRAGRPGQMDRGKSGDEGLGEAVASGRLCGRHSGAHSLHCARREWAARSGASALTRWSGQREESKWDLWAITVLSDFIRGPGSTPNSPDDDSTHPSPAPAWQGVE